MPDRRPTGVNSYTPAVLDHVIGQTTGRDWLYDYDNLNRLTDGRRGTLNANKDALTSTRFRDDNTDGDLADAEDDTLYYCNDANMNVTALVKTDGTVVERYGYNPYGKVTFYAGSWGSRSSSSYDNAILYCGYRYNSETGLYHVRLRAYQPTLGRWISGIPRDMSMG